MLPVPTLNSKLCTNIPILKGTCKNTFFYLCFGNIEVMTISQCLLTSQPLCISLFEVIDTVAAYEVTVPITIIRGVTGGTDQTSGGCSLCYTIPI